MPDHEVIAAIASPAAPAARIIVRLSGKGCWEMVRSLIVCDPVRCGVVPLVVNGMRFPATILLFGAGYTGEESAELHLPGNVLLARRTLQSLYGAGARPAEPGEFTARAFLNGRLDLAEAEGVAATIHATSERELTAARRLQSGELARRLAPITDDLTQTLALLEAGIDFSEEDIRFLSPADLAARVQAIIGDLQSLLGESTRFERLAHEPTIVLCGRPNAGKSTLLNSLAGRTRAVVSPTAGTTRDVLEAEVELERGMVRVVDTAGMEEKDEGGRMKDGKGAIEQQMRHRAVAAIRSADVVVLVREVDDDRPVSLPRIPELTVVTKSDLHPSSFILHPCIRVSARTGENLPGLRSRLDELAFGTRGGETLALNARHVQQIETACAELATLLRELGTKTDELSAEHLRYALDALGEITGMVSPDDVLGRVFATFCIGK